MFTYLLQFVTISLFSNLFCRCLCVGWATEMINLVKLQVMWMYVNWKVQGLKSFWNERWSFEIHYSQKKLPFKESRSDENAFEIIIEALKFRLKSSDKLSVDLINFIYILYRTCKIRKVLLQFCNVTDVLIKFITDQVTS